MGKGRGQCAVSSAGQHSNPSPLGRPGPPGTSAALGGGSPQEAEPALTLLSHSSSVMYQASASRVTKVPTCCPFDSKRVPKTAARSFQSGGAEAGEAAGREGQRGVRREGGSEGEREGRPCFPLAEAWGWWNLPSQIQDDQTRLHTQTEVKASCCQGGCQAHEDQSFCMRKTP